MRGTIFRGFILVIFCSARSDGSSIPIRNLRLNGGGGSIRDCFRGDVATSDCLFSPLGSVENEDTEGKPRVVFILGGPGAGKGTQCGKLTIEFRRMCHLSAGDLLRAERRSGSKQGELIEQYIRDGKIVPVEITAGLLKAAIERDKHRYDLFLVDGFPRNLENLRGWRRIVGAAAAVDFMLFFECSEKVLQDRLLRRGLTSGRSDDNAASIRKRFQTYVSETLPVVRYFESQGRLRRVNSDRPVGSVYAEVRRMFEPLMQRRLLGRRLLGGRLPSLRTLIKGSFAYKAASSLLALALSLASTVGSDSPGEPA